MSRDAHAPGCPLGQGSDRQRVNALGLQALSRAHGGSYLQGEAAFEQRREQLRQASWLQRLSPACLPPLRNDLQRVVEPETAAVQTALRLLSTVPESLAVAMSGSGPSCFALMPSMEACQRGQDRLQEAFTAAGLQAWCCGLSTAGVTVERGRD